MSSPQYSWPDELTGTHRKPAEQIAWFGRLLRPHQRARLPQFQEHPEAVESHQGTASHLSPGSARERPGRSILLIGCAQGPLQRVLQPEEKPALTREPKAIQSATTPKAND